MQEPMSNSPGEEALRRVHLVDVKRSVISRQPREGDDIRFGHRATGRTESVLDLEVFEVSIQRFEAPVHAR